MCCKCNRMILSQWTYPVDVLHVQPSPFYISLRSPPNACVIMSLIKPAGINTWDLICLCMHLPCLTLWGLVTHTCARGLCHHWFIQVMVTCSTPSHCLIQCWLSLIGTSAIKLGMIWIEIENFSLQQNAFECVICKMYSILFWLKWVKCM